MSHKIIIIDDSADFTFLLQMRLEAILGKSEFHTFTSLTAAKETLDKKTESFDLAIIDQNLPDGMGSDFLKEGYLEDVVVLSMSSDEDPNIPAESIIGGANFFLSKNSLNSDLFPPLVKGLIQKNKLSQELNEANRKLVVLDTIKKMVSTLHHEVNNPLSAIYGAVFFLNQKKQKTEGEEKAIELIDQGAKRIKEIIAKLQDTNDIIEEFKANEALFKIPGDPDWEEK